MTTYFQFLSTNNKAQSFMPTFDGSLYNVTIVWNISAQRYYVKCESIAGDLIFFVPLVGNPNQYEIADIEYDQQNQRVVATMSQPHLTITGRLIYADIIGCVPSQYNGSGFITILNRTQIAYPLSQDPGPATVLGVLDYLISMTKGYFQSTMIFRNGYFEVNP
jgi:hypothetical protein